MEKRRLWGEPTAAFYYLRGAYKQEEIDFLHVHLHLQTKRFRLDFRQKFFTEKVVRCWKRLLRVLVDAPSLEALKARLDGVLGSLTWWLAI